MASAYIYELGHVQPEDDSDAAIKARVESALSGRADIDVRYLSLDVDNRLVTISRSARLSSVFTTSMSWTGSIAE